MFDKRYHVPRSQVWRGSRGRQSGRTHLHVTQDITVGRISRNKGRALCGRAGWYERPAEGQHEVNDICPRCAEIATRLRNGL
jgi:hypothetical protein